MRKTVATFMLLGAIGCDKAPTAPSVKEDTSVAWQNQVTTAKLVGDPKPVDLGPVPQPMFVSVTSEHTGVVNTVMIEHSDPQLPTCAGRDLVFRRHIETGGARNDIFRLSDGHRVYSWDIGPGLYDYQVFDYPTNWCQR